MRKLNKNQRELIENYVLNCLDEDVTIEFFASCYLSEYGHNLKRYNGHLRNMVEYLQGLPSTIDQAFYHDEIYKLMISWGLLKISDSDEKYRQAAEEYWLYISAALLKLARAEKLLC